MVSRHVLAAIAKGLAAEGSEADDVARKALSRIDWVLRGRARRRLEQALMDALASRVADGDPDATRHQLRAAALIVRKRAEVDLADHQAVELAYRDAAAVPEPSRLPIASIAAAVCCLAISSAVATAAVLAGDIPPPPGSYSRPAPPLAVGAFRDGGVPARDPGIEALLRDELPQVFRHRTGEREPFALANRPQILAAWRGVVDEVTRYDRGDNRFRDAASDLRARVQVLSDQLAAAELGYYLDLEISPLREPFASAYRVDKVTFVRAGEDRVRVLDLRRLGGPSSSALGMKPEGLSDPVAMLDQIDEHVDTQLMPVVDGRSYGLVDDGWTRTGRGRAAASAVTKAIRRELAVALGHDYTDPDKVKARLRKLVLASVRHHEAQHGLEQERMPGYPKALEQVLGPLRDGSGHANPKAVRASMELSAYTSQIASDMWLPQVALWNLSRHAFQVARHGTPEAIAAVLVIEGLARELGVPVRESAIRGTNIDRDRLGQLVAPLAERPTVELRSAAARLWAELFGEPLVRLVDDRFGE